MVRAPRSSGSGRPGAVATALLAYFAGQATPPAPAAPPAPTLSPAHGALMAGLFLGALAGRSPQRWQPAPPASAVSWSNVAAGNRGARPGEPPLLQGQVFPLPEVTEVSQAPLPPPQVPQLPPFVGGSIPFRKATAKGRAR